MRQWSNASVPDLLVTGTDTGVGKTVIAAALILALRISPTLGCDAIGSRAWRNTSPLRETSPMMRPSCKMRSVASAAAQPSALPV